MNKLFNIFFVMITALLSCSNHNEVQKPLNPSASDAEISGSFVGKFSRFSKGENYHGTLIQEWNDTVWKNERIYQQIMLWTKEECVDNISFEISDLASGENIIPKENFSLRFVDYVLGDAQALTCGYQENRTDIYIGDALSDSDVPSMTMSDPLKVWISVDIPKDIESGRYTGTLSVKKNELSLIVFDICFTVTNNLLPDVSNWDFHLDLWQFPFQLAYLGNVTPFSPDYYSMIKPFYSLLAQTGQKAITTYIKDGAFTRGYTMVDWSLTASGDWKFDYTNFDAFVEFMQNLGINKQINCFSLAGWYNSIGYWDEASNKYLYKSLSIGSNEYNEIWSNFLTDFASHLNQKGWMDKTVLYMDENSEDEMDLIVSLIKKNNTRWKIGLAGREVNTQLERKLYDYSTIIGYNRGATNNVNSTFYTSCSQSHPNNYVTLETDPAEMTWMAWHALANGFNGYLRWAFDYWTKTDPLDVRDGTNSAGDFNMIYRSGNGVNAKPISSIRLELLRDGIQDYEKVKILGSTKMRDVLKLFSDTDGTNAKAQVLTAQEKLKQLSIK